MIHKGMVAIIQVVVEHEVLPTGAQFIEHRR
jgi:hypothetical protein